MNLKDTVQLMKAVSADVAQFIRTEHKKFDATKAEIKGQNDLVSYVDKESERMLVEQLHKIAPHAGFLTEEKTVEQTSAEYQWIIDPLDGTTNFVHGIPAFSVSIALAREDEVVAGVVHEVTRNECFNAWKGGGAFLGDDPIRVSSVAALNESLFITGLPVQGFDKKRGYLKIISDLMEKSHGVRRLGSAATDLAYVACGRAEGFYECNLNPWDVAAGALLVQEAGGKVTDFSGGNNFLHGKEIVGASAVHPELLVVIQKNWK